MKRGLQILMIVAGVHIIGVLLYFAVAPYDDHPSKYGHHLGQGIFGGLFLPLFAALGPSVLKRLPDSFPLAITLFIANSFLWAILVMLVAYALRKALVRSRARRNI